MTRPSDEQLLRFLEGRMDPEALEAFLARLDADPALAAELAQAAAGWEAASAAGDAQKSMGQGSGRRSGGPVGESGPASRSARPTGAHARRISPWWAVAASVATLAVSVPTTAVLVGDESAPVEGRAVDPPEATTPAQPFAIPSGIQPSSPQPSFVLVLQGRWPDLGTVDPETARTRAARYWGWTADLAERGLLLAAGDLRWEPGARVATDGQAAPVDATYLDSEGFVVGMFALRVGTYEEALAIAQECPHLEYGGTVAVRQVGSGFVTAPGQADWSG